MQITSLQTIPYFNAVPFLFAIPFWKRNESVAKIALRDRFQTTMMREVDGDDKSFVEKSLFLRNWRKHRHLCIPKYSPRTQNLL